MESHWGVRLETTALAILSFTDGWMNFQVKSFYHVTNFNVIFMLSDLFAYQT